MIRIVRATLFSCLVLLYGLTFLAHEQKAVMQTARLEANLPSSFYRIASGYLQQLTAEMLFIRTSVFLGGLLPGVPASSYEVALGNNFEVMTQLYPQFIDPYFYCQGFLPQISMESAAKASTIFETGVKTHPENFVLRLFYGSNFFLAMNEYLKAATAFSEAAEIPDAPPLFGHLSALLSAQGGNIAAGLISLKTLLSTEKDENVRARYEEEIKMFEQALDVQKAINIYSKKYGSAPQTLDQLIPDFLPQLPELHDPLVLVYERPNLYLRRLDKKSKK